ncbi:MAG: hypothetical protein JWM59_3424 [Verrucomicrobiales bacterium]|nr:hypothetical protein [Verrucomicrobiales bacterium]
MMVSSSSTVGLKTHASADRLGLIPETLSGASGPAKKSPLPAKVMAFTDCTTAACGSRKR